jgi:hypothetical protein
VLGCFKLLVVLAALERVQMCSCDSVLRCDGRCTPDFKGSRSVVAALGQLGTLDMRLKVRVHSRGGRALTAPFQQHTLTRTHTESPHAQHRRRATARLTAGCGSSKGVQRDARNAIASAVTGTQR